MILNTFRAIAFILALFVCSFATPNNLFDYFYRTWQENNNSISYFPNLTFGTHLNGIGINSEGIYWLPINKLPFGLGTKLDANGMFYEEYIGFPERSGMAEAGGTFLIGWGKRSNFGDSKWIRISPYRHSIHYRFCYYYSTDKTSQAYAEYQYVLNFSNKSFIIRVGNDDETFIPTDRFRSAAVDLNLYINKTDYLIGYSFGLKLWHGDYTDQLYLNRNQTYDFNGISGGEYSLGLLFGTLTFNCFKFSVGYDSDKVRTFFQNGMHKIMNNGMTPDVKRDDRIYFSFTLFENNGQW